MSDLAGADVETLAALIDETDDPETLHAIAVALDSQFPWAPQEHQQPPAGEWWAWVFSAGSGTGKTDVGAWWINEHMMGPACDPRVPGGHKALIAGPTFGDAVTTCWTPPAGISAHNQDVRLVGRRGMTYGIWPNGAEALFAGLHSEHDVGLLRGRAANCCTFWIDEAAMAEHLALAVDLIQQRARLGHRPHGIVTSTPKTTAGWKYLISLPRVEVTYASSFDNQFLPEWHRENLQRFIGTRMEAQEIQGRMLEEYAGALWSRDQLDTGRRVDSEIMRLPPAERLAALGIVRVAVGIDPSTWIPPVGGGEEATEGGKGTETGVVTVGIDGQNPPHVYVLADSSGRLSAEEWARRAAADYHAWRAAWVVPETNIGGPMTLATLALTDPSVTVYREPSAKRPGVHASVGKRARAEPVALLADQDRFHLVGSFPALESTLVTWDPTESWSPDRLDAMVWAVTALRPWRARRGAGVAGRGLARA